MSENGSQVVTEQAPDGDTVAQTGDVSVSQADVDRIVRERVNRERAKFADYADLQKAAARLKEIETADLTAQEKAATAVAEAKAEAEAARADVARYRVAAAHGISTDTDIELVGAGTEEQVEERAKRIGALLAAERELAELKASGKTSPPLGRPAVREWAPGATPVEVKSGPSAKDRAAAQVRQMWGIGNEAK